MKYLSYLETNSLMPSNENQRELEMKQLFPRKRQKEIQELIKDHPIILDHPEIETEIAIRNFQ